MRILCVCSSWRVFGAETITLKMLDGLKRKGHQLHAISSTWSDGEFSRRLAALEIPETRVPLGTFSKKLAWRPMLWTADALVRLPSLWFQFNRVVSQFAPEVVVYTGSRQAAFLYPWLSAKPSFLIEYTNIQPNRSNACLYRFLSRKLSGFIAVSDFMRGHLERVGAPWEKIRVIRSGAFFQNDARGGDVNGAENSTSGAKPIRVGIVGQVAPNKGYDCLLEAVRLLQMRRADVSVSIFGAGSHEYTEHLKAKVAAAGLCGCWHWMGYERDKEKIFGGLDICVVPSCFGDPFPTVAMEAGVYGLPVVASRVGGLPEIIEDCKTGLLVDPNAPDQLADKIAWLIQNPQQASAMGLAARRRVFDQFTVERMVSEFELLFREHVHRAQTPQPMEMPSAAAVSPLLGETASLSSDRASAPPAQAR